MTGFACRLWWSTGCVSVWVKGNSCMQCWCTAVWWKRCSCMAEHVFMFALQEGEKQLILQLFESPAFWKLSTGVGLNPTSNSRVTLFSPWYTLVHSQKGLGRRKDLSMTWQHLKVFPECWEVCKDGPILSSGVYFPLNRFPNNAWNLHMLPQHSYPWPGTVRGEWLEGEKKKALD